MNSGKSTALLQVAYNYEERGQIVLVAKPSVDTKAGDAVSSRLGMSRQVDISITPELDIYDHFLRILAANSEEDHPIDCILIDEAQFLTRRQVDALFAIAVKQNVPIIAYGLRTDFQARAFEGSQRLLEIAHSIEELKTICRCGRKAVLNGRKDALGAWISQGEQVAIDGENVTYESLCGTCYFEKVGDFASDPFPVGPTVLVTEDGHHVVVTSGDDPKLVSVLDIGSRAAMPALDEVKHRALEAENKEDLKFPSVAI
jgi:thymidine kinase